MRRLIISLLAVGISVSGMAQGRVVKDEVKSRILNHDVKVKVYVPDGYDAKNHYPVVYMLHGLSDSEDSWTSKGQMDRVADLLINSGEAAKMVVVMPCAGGPDVHNIQNGYFNVKDWPYEDFFFDELMPLMESKYNCGGTKGQRAIMGLSMGGGGSVVYCQRHPDMFSSCYAMSPWLDNKQSEVLGDSVPGSKLVLTDLSVREHSALDFLENADESTLDKLRTVKWFVDCGDDDFLIMLSLNFYVKMFAKEIKMELRVRDGIHNWEYWHTALYKALPFASRNFY